MGSFGGLGFVPVGCLVGFVSAARGLARGGPQGGVDGQFLGGRFRREQGAERLQEIPRVGDSEDAYGRTLAYVYLDADKDGSYEHAFNEDLIVLGLARTSTFSHTYRRKFERLREEAEERGMGLWSACPDTIIY